MTLYLVALITGRDLTHEAHVIIADVNDEASLNLMCSSAKIVLNCVGPVSLFLVLVLIHVLLYVVVSRFLKF